MLFRSVLTSQYDNARTGANVHETLLTPENVNTRQFGKLYSFPVDGDGYAQPLFMPNIEIAGKGKHNVVFVATEHDSVYAFDGNAVITEPLWHVNFLDSARGIGTVPSTDVNCPFILPELASHPHRSSTHKAARFTYWHGHESVRVELRVMCRSSMR